MEWIHGLMDEYHSFLKDKTKLTSDQLTGWVEISTPFLNMFNDPIDLYAKQQGEKIVLSDDGETLKNLELSGVPVSRSNTRKQLMEQILINYGVRLEDGELGLEASAYNFPQKKLNLLTAISEINDLYFMAKHTVATAFKEDVQSYLDEQGIIYTPHFLARGKTGIEFSFDFQIAYRKTEIVMKSFSMINKQNLPQFLFTWEDVKQVREQQAQKAVIGLAVINDEDRKVQGEYLDALDSKGAQYILWSERHKPDNINKLKAVA